MTEAGVLTEVPQELKLLVRVVMRAFYGDEHAIVMDKLIHHPCIKEDDLLDLLRFERKQLRAIISTLRNEKFVRVRMRMEYESDVTTTTGQRGVRVNYYFISYSALVNVVKYKLDHIHRKIETDERHTTNRASFHCPECLRKYTDLEVGQLFDPMTQQLMCSYCHTEVAEEKVDKLCGGDSRSLMVMFNEQTEPVVSLLKKVEVVKLSDEILEPQVAADGKGSKLGGSRGGAGGMWSSDKGVSFGATESRVTITVDSKTANAPNARPTKEVPTWIAQSTVDGADNVDSQPSVSRASSVSIFADTSRDVDTNDDIMRTLLSCEKKSSSVAAAAAGFSSVQDKSSSSDSDDELESAVKQTWHSTTDVETMETGLDDVEEDVDMFVVCVGDKKFAVNEVPDEYINQMTAQEKQDYIRLAQLYYEQFI